ncbi:MAG: hypothetical protein R3F29_08570 [Planctomycetota bacterium]
MNHFIPSRDPAEGLGVLMLFRLIEESIPAFFRPDRTIHVARAPGRLDVMGGLAGEAAATVLHLPIAEAACTAIQARDDDLVRLWSPCRDGSRTQMLSLRLGDLGLPAAPIAYAEGRALLTADPRDRWAGYLLGGLLALARERAVLPPHGAELLLHSDVPSECGVAASTSIIVAALRAFALLYGFELTAHDLAELCQIVETEVLGVEARRCDPMTTVLAESGELLVLDGPVGDLSGRLAVPSDLEFVALDTGVRRVADAPTPVALGADAGRADADRVARFRSLLEQPPSLELRSALGDVMFDAHDAYVAAGRSHAAADLVVQQARARREAGGGVLGAKLTGVGGGATVLLLGERTKVWYEALRLKKALLEATGHSAHVFRWSSPGALSFGSIELAPDPDRDADPDAAPERPDGEV